MDFKRVVIKVGSALVSPDGSGCSGKYIEQIAHFVTQYQKQGKEVILVSSGSVSAGRDVIHHGSPNPSISVKQAMASVGQMKMMANWQQYFSAPCSQILITHADIRSRQRYINIKNTLRVLLKNGVIPIVNENDTVAVEELKVGDNDNLAALVALVSDSDCLIILSDIDGVYNKDPRVHADAVMIKEIAAVTPEIYAMAGATNNHIATGGMKTKIQAADKAVENGIETYILNGHKASVFEQMLKGENPGTRFVAKEDSIKAKKNWLKHTLRSTGTLSLDTGAVKALVNKGASLLPSGIVAIEGQFFNGDSVDILNAETNQIIAKGICQYSFQDLHRIMGHQSEEIETLLGFRVSNVVIHRNDMILL